jgi:peroxiredoxin
MATLRSLRNLTRSTMFYVVLGFFLMVPVAVWCHLRSAAKPPPQEKRLTGTLDEVPGLEPGEVAILDTLTDLAGQPVDLRADSPYLLLCFFSSAICPGCSGEVPVWRSLAAQGKELGVRTVVVTTDTDLAAIRRYVEAYEIADLPVLYDPAGKVFEKFQIQLLPQYILFNRRGKVLHRALGYSGVQGFEPAERAAAILAAAQAAKSS